MIFLESNAFFSSCGLYRWWLKRSISNEKRTLLFIGLNPSKANDKQDDATLKRLLGFTCYWGYGTLIVVNLFGRVSKSPSLLRHCSDPIGKRNDEELSFKVYEWSKSPLWDLWYGWGVKGTWIDRNLKVLSLLERHVNYRAKKLPDALGPLSIGLTRDGHPRHPLYASSKEVLRPFN